MKKLAFLISIAALLNMSFLSYQISFLYYPMMLLVFSILIILSREIKIDALHLWLIIAAIISILLNEIPEIFKPYGRLGIFIAIGGLVGPFIKSQRFIEFRKKTFNYLNSLIVIVVVASAVGNIVGLPLVYNYSGFSGLFNQSMMMGPMSAISFLIVIYSIKKEDSIERKRILYFAGFLCFYACVAAGSRGALIAGLGGFLFFLYTAHGKNIGSFSRTLILLLFLGLLTYPVWESQTSFLQKKFEHSEREGDFTASRSDLWDERILEFQSSPIVGVGFASVDPDITERFDEVTGTVEPGSSWLVLLSMIGISGFLPFLLIVIRELKPVLTSRTISRDLILLGSLLVIFIIHMIGEGYVLSAGSGLFFYLWLILGVLDIKRTREQDSPLKISFLR